ncbi:hypothetical protein SAY86_000886 [Trapa natans]|uniref:Homeobox domain-containing protein n=1 Tax=Trapa natans TaxID=22666 RepID=A0AAN7RND1_TRANT|nr:hypothetical protein SAY86_000886 [Trapa natans]
MKTFYDDWSERIAAPVLYLKEHLPSSYQETQVLPGNVTMYMNSASCSDTLGIDSSSQQQQEIVSNYSGLRVAEQDINALREFHALGGGPSVIHQNGLSLSPGTQIPGAGFHTSSPPYPNEVLKDGDFALQGNPGSSPDMSSISRIIPNSRYLKAAQQLLDEVVSTSKALKQLEDAKDGAGAEKHTQEGKIFPDIVDGVKNEDGGSSSSKGLSHSERQELQNKLAKLFGMLDEVDKRYKQYYHQMQIVASSLDTIAGPGAAKPYTSFALQRISLHFRCLKDAINGQISATRKGLGEQDSSLDNKGVRIARLRYVDQQLRQHKALQQQLGIMQPDSAWRPQRGLPESSVSILRAWLFEHFLHPYPKDSDKIMLARQTDLSRSQVSNWFINARVRLWKPMVEDMYKEEFGHMEMDSHSSSENAVNLIKGYSIRSHEEERGEDESKRTAASEVHNWEESEAGHYPRCVSGVRDDYGMAGSGRELGAIFRPDAPRRISTESELAEIDAIRNPNPGDRYQGDLAA